MHLIEENMYTMQLLLRCSAVRTLSHWRLLEITGNYWRLLTQTSTTWAWRKYACKECNYCGCCILVLSPCFMLWSHSQVMILQGF